MNVSKVVCFPNGNTMVFDEEGKQIPKLQKSWLSLYIEFLKSKGVEPEGLSVKLPDEFEVEIIKTRHGYSWQAGFRKTG